MVSQGSFPIDADAHSNANPAWFHVACDGVVVPDVLQGLAAASGGMAARTLREARARAGARAIVVVCPSPATAIAAHLVEGEALEKTVADWLERTNSHVEQLRQIRRQAVVIDPDTLNTRPDTILPKLLRRLQIDAPSTLGQASRMSEAPVDPVLLGLAHLAIAASDETRDLCDELEAMTLGAPAFPSRAALARASADLNANRRIQAQTTSERDLLREEVVRLSRTLSAMTAPSTEDTTPGIDPEREHVLGRQILQLSDRLAAREDELSRMKRSRSWRYTRPLRRQR